MKYDELSVTQKGAFKKLLSDAPKEAVSAYDLSESLNTLKSLCSKDYIEYYGHKIVVKSKSELGSMAFPRTSILFRIFRKKETDGND